MQPHQQAEMAKVPPRPDEPVMGVPYYVAENPYQAGMIPPNAVFDDPKGIPIQQTIYRDTPAPFNCVYCGDGGLTNVRSKLSLAAIVGCLVPFGVGICCLMPQCDCLWHKYHFCPHCHQKVGEFEKTDPCLAMDPASWTEHSFGLPAQ